MPPKPTAFLAIISVIHANIDALTAVLVDSEQFPVKGMLCLGNHEVPLSHDPSGFHDIHDQAEAVAHFAAQTTFIAFNGHTHVPATWEREPRTSTRRCLMPVDNPVLLDANKRHSVNVGSVDQPRDEDPRASYVLYDEERWLCVSWRGGWSSTSRAAAWSMRDLSR